MRNVKLNPLTPDEERVIAHKGTEAPFTGEYDNFYKEGMYVCRRCDQPLYSSKAKFDAGCGWPAFDEFVSGSVQESPNGDPHFGYEITCANCGGHLGHVYRGERLTEKDTRHCVNSLSIKFLPAAV